MDWNWRVIIRHIGARDLKPFCDHVRTEPARDTIHYNDNYDIAYSAVDYDEQEVGVSLAVLSDDSVVDLLPMVIYQKWLELNKRCDLLNPVHYLLREGFLAKDSLRDITDVN